MQNEVINIRRFHKVLRDRMTEDMTEFHSVNVRRHMRRLIAGLPWELPVLCYYPAGNEVDLRRLYQEWLDRGKSLYFPVTRMKERRLDFFRADSLEDFRAGTMGIMEPEYRDRAHQLPEDIPAISVTPGLAFDKRGNRIGYGMGFYDRFFAAQPLILRVGTAYSSQIEKRLPEESWDMPLDYLVTEEHIYQMNREDFKTE